MPSGSKYPISKAFDTKSIPFMNFGTSNQKHWVRRSSGLGLCSSTATPTPCLVDLELHGAKIRYDEDWNLLIGIVVGRALQERSMRGLWRPVKTLQTPPLPSTDLGIEPSAPYWSRSRPRSHHRAAQGGDRPSGKTARFTADGSWSLRAQHGFIKESMFEVVLWVPWYFIP